MSFDERLGRLHALAQRRCRAQGPAHDFAHVSRVRALAVELARTSDANALACELGALLHELWNYPKGHPRSRESGDVCARHAKRAVRAAGYPNELAELVAAMIRDHAFSKGGVPESLEGKILQDADRLDAIGAIGIARCFASCAEMGSAFYDVDDPFAERRPLDDKRFGLDHFEKKLLRLEAGMHTEPAKVMAAERSQVMRAFLAAMRRELEG